MLKQLSKKSEQYISELKSNLEKEQNIFLDKIKGKQSSKIKTVIRLATIILICVVFVLLWTNRYVLAPDNIGIWIRDSISSIGSGSGYPCSICGINVDAKNIKMMGSDLVYLSDTSFIAMNNSAKEMSNRQHSMNLPVLKASGNRAIAYNLGEKGFQIETKSKNLYKGNAENDIISGDISQNGEYGLLTEQSGYFGEMDIFSKSNNGKYKYCFSQHYVNEISMGHNGKYAAVSGTSAKDGVLKSVVYVFDFKNDKPKLIMEYNDNVILSVKCLSNGNIAVVGDKMFSIINANKEKKYDYNYDDRHLTAFDINPEKGIALSLSKTSDGRGCDILRFDIGGTKLNDIVTELKINSISYNGDVCAAFSAGEIYVYGHYGNLRGTWKAGNNIKNIVLSSSKTAYTLGTTEIGFIRFK